MKQTLLIIVLFIGLGNLNAQQSDATLEETINWLNEHSLPNQLFKTTTDDLIKIDYKINTNELISYEKGGHIGKHQLNSVKTLVITYNSGVNGVSYWINITHLTDFSMMRYCFSNNDKELALRTYKAFTHLFELLNHDIAFENHLSDQNIF